MRVWVEEQGLGIICLVYFLFLFVLLSFGLSCSVSSLSEQSMIAVVSVSLFIICFPFLRSL